jgi:hypothetical protein
MNLAADGAVVACGADFCQKVVISGLGTAGSLLVALGLLALNQWLHRRQEKKKEQVELRWRLADRVAAFRDELLTDPTVLALPANRGYSSALRFMFSLTEFELRTKDPAIKRYCDERATTVRDFWSVYRSPQPADHATLVMGFLDVVFSMEDELRGYIVEGRSIPSLAVDWKAMADGKIDHYGQPVNSKKPGPSEEEPG